MPAVVDTRELEPGVTAYQISSSDREAVLLEIEQITGRAGDHCAEFSAPCRSFDINDPVKRWRSRGVVRSLEHA